MFVKNKEDAIKEQNFLSQRISFLKKISLLLFGISRFLCDLGGFVVWHRSGERYGTKTWNETTGCWLSPSNLW